MALSYDDLLALFYSFTDNIPLQMAPKTKKTTSDNINSKLQLVIKSGKVVSTATTTGAH